jgi:hypothetical protein
MEKYHIETMVVSQNLHIKLGDNPLILEPLYKTLLLTVENRILFYKSSNGGFLCKGTLQSQTYRLQQLDGQPSSYSIAIYVKYLSSKPYLCKLFPSILLMTTEVLQLLRIYTKYKSDQNKIWNKDCAEQKKSSKIFFLP